MIKDTNNEYNKSSNNILLLICINRTNNPNPNLIVDTFLWTYGYI